MEAVMEHDADAVDEVVGALQTELQAMDAEYNGLLESMRESQRRIEERGGGGGGGGALNARTGGGDEDDDGVVVTGDGEISDATASGGGGGLDPAELAEAANRAAWLMERMEAKGAQILQLTTLAGHSATTTTTTQHQ